MTPTRIRFSCWARAATVVVSNSHLWHGGTLNRTDKRPAGVHSYFCRRGLPQQLDKRKYLRVQTRV